MATKPPQSLPSFAQTFGGPSSINTRLPDMNTSLPPIQHRPPALERNRSSPSQRPSPQPQPSDTKQSSRKRLHAETSATSNEDNQASDDRRSPRSVRIKEEVDYEQLPPNSQSRQTPSSQSQSSVMQETTSITPSAASPAGPNPSKKRRVTISGMSQPINTDVRRPSVDSGISPVVMGFTIMRDDPAALEQVRSMLTVKQKQKALIEQRRGSTAGIVTPIAPPAVNIVNPRPGSEEYQAPPPKPPGRGGGRRSPSNPSGSRRSVVAAASSAPPPVNHPPHTNAPPTNPPPHVVPSQQQPPPLSASQHPAQPAQPEPQAPSQTHLHPSAASNNPTPSTAVPAPPHALPPQPISFARRRAGRQLGSGKLKPADIVISPREPHTEGQLQPLIQSAPPIPKAGQGQPSSGRFPSMAIPSLPSVMTPGHVVKRLTSGQVPPTPTRLTMRQSIVGITSGRSPPASVPIASTLVPPTPSSLHHSGYTGEKEAFLAPFEMLYNTFSDTRQLKNWLGEQLQKSNTLVVSLQKQQEKMEETVTSLVDKKVASMREEVYGLRVRVEELEHQLRVSRGAGYSPNMAPAKAKAKANGYAVPQVGVVPETYTFPPVDPLRRPEPVRRALSPNADKDSEPRSVPGSQTASPVPFEYGRRLSISAMRLDPPRQPAEAQSPSVVHRAASYSTHTREAPSGHAFYAPPPPQSLSVTASGSSKGGSWSPHTHKPGLPTSSTRTSLRETTLSSASDRGGLSRQPSQSQSGHRYGEKPPLSREMNGSGESGETARGDGDREKDRDREKERERDQGSDRHPATSQRRDSIAAPGSAGSSSSASSQNQHHRGRAKSPVPMDED